MSERHQDMCLECEEEVWWHNVPLKAEHKRENRTGKESSVVGNAAKMREALDSIYNKLETLDVEEDSYADEVIASVKSDIVDALAAPTRNCDVGTMEEQAERFMKFCEAHKPDEHQFTEHGELLCPSTGCELIACNYGQCALAWAQMPYEEGDAK